MGQLATDFDWNTLGFDQADSLLTQMKDAKSKYSKQALRHSTVATTAAHYADKKASDVTSVI